MTTRSLFEVIDRATGRTIVRREPLLGDWDYLAACMVISSEGITPIATDGGRRYTVEGDTKIVHIYKDFEVSR